MSEKSVVELKVLTITRHILHQIPFQTHLSDVEFHMVHWDGWIAQGATSGQTPELFVGHIGPRWLTYPTISMLEPMRTHMLHTLPQIYIP
jgi:hypothetical protein